MGWIDVFTDSGRRRRRVQAAVRAGDAPALLDARAILLDLDRNNPGDRQAALGLLEALSKLEHPEALDTRPILEATRHLWGDQNPTPEESSRLNETIDRLVSRFLDADRPADRWSR